MIYDQIENVSNYKGISNRLDKALDFIHNLDINNLVVGKFPIEDDKLFYMVSEYDTITEDLGKYESHNNYMDIQLLVSGNESIRCTPYENPEITVPYNSDKDIEFYKLDKGYDFLLKPGTFALIMPKELHAPKLMAQKVESVKKVVVKILA